MSRLSHLCRPVVLLALLPALLLGGCASDQAVAPVPAPAATAAAAPPKPYVRLRRLGEDAFALRLCIREFRPASGQGPAIYLAGAIHIGEPAYYEALQKHLDAQQIVLFEGVRSRDEEANLRQKGNRAKDVDFYSRLSRALGLVSQTTHIDYRRPHFRNADLTFEEVREHLAQVAKAPGEEGEDARRAMAQFAMLQGFLMGDNPLVSVTLWAIENHPETRAKMRLLMLTKLSAAMGEEANPILSPRLMRAILNDRNDAALGDLAKVLRESPAARSISIFYGAAHLADMEQKLRKQFGYLPVHSTWLTSMTVHPLAEGMSKEEVNELMGE